MADKLREIYETLDNIKIYIRKLNYERRRQPILKSKLDEAKACYSKLSSEITLINQQIKNSDLDDSQISLIKDFVEKIKKLYSEILEFQTKTDSTDDKMTSFDLKTAVSLLPILDDTEETTNKLVDAIELYESLLKVEDKPTLIKFVLKTRLTNSAKLRLNNSYDTIADLLVDIKRHLLTRQSDTALQSKLFRAKQGQKSIESFGKELESLFVNLTISQANGDDNSFAILKPINEKIAIKRFSDGLRDQKLSTIIAARNFSFLKDAIRAAQDEETTSFNNNNNNSNSQVFTLNRRGRGNFSGNFTRGSFSDRNSYNNRNNDRRNFNQNNNHNSEHQQSRPSNSRNFRGRLFTRGSGYRRGSRPNRHNLQFADVVNPGQVRDARENIESSTDSLADTFFRP